MSIDVSQPSLLPRSYSSLVYSLRNHHSRRCVTVTTTIYSKYIPVGMYLILFSIGIKVTLGFLALQLCNVQRKTNPFMRESSRYITRYIIRNENERRSPRRRALARMLMRSRCCLRCVIAKPGKFNDSHYFVTLLLGYSLVTRLSLSGVQFNF